jgi:hypothetical protein
MTKPIYILLRTVHGVAWALMTSLAAGYVINSLIDHTRGIVRVAGSELVPYGILVSVLFVTGYFAFFRFQKCSFRLAMSLFGLWFLLFVWHGWFSTTAPYRFHEVIPSEYLFSAYLRVGLTVSIWTMAFAIFPILRAGHRGQRAKT